MTESRLRDEASSREVTDRILIHEGKVWDVVSETFTYGDESLTREFIDHTGAVAVLAVDDDDRVLLIRQYRHPVGLIDWEIPAGLLDEPGESTLDAAKRELAEEADLRADEWSVLVDYATTPGSTTETIRIFLARGVSATDEPFAREGEEADIETRWVPLDEAVEAVMRGDLHNGTTIVALFTAAKLRANGKTSGRDANEPFPLRPSGPGGS